MLTLHEEAVQQIMEEVHRIAVKHGWWKGKRNKGECIALMHSELSEALEALRNGNLLDEHCPEFSSATVELADCVIRIFDFAEANGMDLPGALRAKIAYNRTRPYKHGGKKF